MKIRTFLRKPDPSFWMISAGIAVLLLIIILAPGRKPDVQQVEKPPFNPGHTAYISAYSSGLVPRDGTIKVRFAHDLIPLTDVGKEVEKSLFSFSPSIKGKTTWMDTRTVEFKPEENLSSGTVYDAELNLGKLYDTVPSDLADFHFQVNTRLQEMDLTIAGIKPMSATNVGWQRLDGTIRIAEPELNERIEEIIKVKAEGKERYVRWVHGEDGLTHRFTVDSIQRQEAREKVVVVYDGEPINVDRKGTEEVEVPAKGDFLLTSSRANNEPEQFAELQFSDPIDPAQKLEGLIHSRETGFTFQVEGGTIKAFPTKKLTGSIHIAIEPGIRNILGYKIKTQQTADLNFEDIKPQVKILGRGNIVPRTNGSILLPFEAVNLKAVDVRVLKIYESNVLQFLQFNSMDGQQYLDYVGKVVYQKKFSLGGDPKINLGKWNKHAIDLSKFVASEPGAIYSVSIRFRKEYSMYACAQEQEEEENNDREEYYEEDEYYYGEYAYNPHSRSEHPLPGDEPKLWDYYDRYSYYYGSNTSPCKEYYYRSSEGLTRNVLASDLGLLAKRGTDGSTLVAVTDLNTTDPLQNVTVELYDLQRKLVRKGVTDGDGIARFDIKDEPFVVVAKHGNQRGYLKLNENAISLHKFEVDGARYYKGIKGFMYGDRGVWRPGDSIYLTFIMDDPRRAVPMDHPVIFEFINPRGQSVQKTVKRNSLNGFYSFPTATSLNAPTGNYTARVNVGGEVFEKTIKVETVMPNRLRLKLDFPAGYIHSKSETIGTLSSSWLHGAPAKNMKADISVVLRRDEAVFTKWKEYSFSDPTKSFSSENAVIFDGTLNEQGKANIPNKISLTNSAPGPLSASFECRVFEPGGAFSKDYFSSTYHPYDQYVGVGLPKGEGEYGVLLTDREHTVTIATVDRDGKPVAGTVDAYLYKLEWRWWWEYSGAESSYNGRTFENLMASGSVTTVNGKGQWKIKVPENEYGRYLVRLVDKNGHSTGRIVYIDNPGWYYRRPDNTAGSSLLTFSTNKTKYSIGEAAMVDIPTGYDGRALVTIESGNRVVKAEWIKAQKTNTRYSFKVTADMAPNVYVYVTLLQPHAQTVNDLPIRLYGVVPVVVDDPGYRIQPVLKLPGVIEPEQKVTLTVSEEKGKPMTYTIAMVDEGLLDLTRFKTPDPWNHFNAKEALQVQTWDVFDQVLGNNTMGIKKLLTIGGDEGEIQSQGVKVQRFKPMVKFLGPFNLLPGQTAKHSFTMPRYVGSVRTMIIAGNNGAYGSAEVTTPVRKPLMVLGTLPRVLRPNEELMLPVSVFAMEDFVKNVSVELKVSPNLKINGSAKQSLVFTQKDEKLVSFPIKVQPELGIATVNIIAKSGNQMAKYDITLEINSPNPRQTRNEDYVIKSNDKHTFTYTPFGMKGTNKVTLEITSLPPLNLENRLSYLIRYPHGCIEQTTSSVFPQLFVNGLLNVSQDQKKEIEKNIKAGIARLPQFQTQNGGFGYWPGDHTASEWGSNFAGHFLVEAHKQGYAVPANLLSRWKAYMKTMANAWTPHPQDRYISQTGYELTQAYRLYLLALAGAPELGAMNRLRERSDLSLMAKWELAAAYWYAGQKQIAESMVRGLRYDIPKYRDLGYTYGSDFRDEAMILEVLTIMGKEKEAFGLMMRLSQIMKTNSWLSTQETSYSLLAMSRYAKKHGTGGVNIEYRTNDGQWKPITATNPISQVVLESKPGVKTRVDLRNKAGSPVYANLVMQGIPAEGDDKTDASNLTMRVKFMDKNGTEIDPSSLEQGKDFIAEIEIHNPDVNRSLDEMALTAMFPSGWEIHNPRMAGEEFAVKSSVPEYMDVKDDRVYFYFDLERSGYQGGRYYDYNTNSYVQADDPDTKIFRVALNASYEGTFYMPSVYCEAMYENTIHATQKGRWVKVVKSRTN